MLFHPRVRRWGLFCWPGFLVGPILRQLIDFFFFWVEANLDCMDCSGRSSCAPDLARWGGFTLGIIFPGEFTTTDARMCIRPSLFVLVVVRLCFCLDGQF